MLPDVPKELCRRSSVRTKQIDEYIRAHALKDSPLTRKYAAIVTRRENRDPEIGRRAFRDELARCGFQSRRICQQASPRRLVSADRSSLSKEIRRVGREAKRLATGQRPVTRNDLLTKALETAEPRHPVSRVKLATDTVLRSPNEVGLRRRANAYGQPVYVSRQTANRWKKLARKVEFVLRVEPAPSHSGDGRDRKDRAHEGKPKPDGAAASQQSTRRNEGRPKRDRTTERSTDLRRVVKKLLRSYRVIGAVGHVGMKAVKVAVELYQTLAKPVWRVHGDGDKNTPGSVAQMVRDLKPLSRLDAHKAAITAMLRRNGTFDEKLRYGEAVYRQARKAKVRVPRKSLVVIREVGSADPKDVAFLLKNAEWAKAQVLFVEREHSRSSLVRAAKSMRPGERRPFPGPERNL